MMIHRDDPQKQANSPQYHTVSATKKRRRRSKKMYIPHRPLAKGYASLDTGAPWVKEQSYVIRAGGFERNLANQTIGCTSRKKDTGPRKTPNPSTNVKKKIRALPPVRKSNQLFLLLSLRQMFFTKPCHFFCFFALIVQVHHPLQTKVFENWFSA